MWASLEGNGPAIDLIVMSRLSWASDVAFDVGVHAIGDGVEAAGGIDILGGFTGGSGGSNAELAQADELFFSHWALAFSRVARSSEMASRID